MSEPSICPVGVLSFDGRTVIYNKTGDPVPRLLGGGTVKLTPELSEAIERDRQHQVAKDVA